VELFVCCCLSPLAAEHWLASQPITAAGSRKEQPNNSILLQFNHTNQQIKLNYLIFFD